MRVTRRGVLSTLGGAAAVGSAGCLGGAGREPEGPAGTPAELVCEEDEFRRLEPPFDEDEVSYTTLVADGEPLFELALDGRTISYGSSVRIALRNRTDEPRETGPMSAFSLQRDTEAGWQDVRGTTDGSADDPFEGDTDEAEAETVHASGEGFVWDLTIRESDLVDVVETESSHPLSVCPPLGTGSYRFVYWGIPEGAIAEEFTVVGPG
ncbi:hypothetical protein AArcSl_1250 [Halalkaliarchaeum desulfuricum]|uniref:Uncharacterized protein n=1 Tax=Halalkaliarchaeum desulfuricum TaxID=2055893 RepID=A0A343TIG0_9EURY|nr:hypothetical protein [Halalkaliarchaeum desulfuricum]AUX08882.1 hypothetical protein AArcSl_1250 [Halalkaliarchaeum desulfuricum]